MDAVGAIIDWHLAGRDSKSGREPIEQSGSPFLLRSGGKMITCVVDYQIDRTREAQFERFCRLWLELTPKFGGVHHGYFLPSDGPSDRALALFSFDSLADYERYRVEAATDERVIAANRLRDTEAGVIRWDRSFFRPLLP